jgi:hypothetical protein
MLSYRLQLPSMTLSCLHLLAFALSDQHPHELLQAAE